METTIKEVQKAVAESEEIVINVEQRLYVIKSLNGYSCLGWDYAHGRAEKVAKWLGIDAPKETPGTVDAFDEYRRIMRLGAEHNAKTGQRCTAELDDRFTSYYTRGERVEVTWKEGYEDYSGYGARTNGRKARFYVGRSTGWLPSYLVIHNRNSRGGSVILSVAVESVRGLGKGRG